MSGFFKIRRGIFKALENKKKEVFRKKGLLVSSEAEFSDPTELEALGLWLDASDADTLFDATSGGSLVGGDGAIARWEDKSGSDNHATQSTSGARPIRKIEGQNELDVVRFDGSKHMLLTNITILLRDKPGATIFIVRKAGSHGSSGLIITFSTSNSLVDRLSIAVLADETMRTAGRRLDSDSFQSAISTATHGTEFEIQGGILDWQNTNAFVYQNGTEVALNNEFQSSGNSDDTDTAAVVLGASLGIANFFNGDIAEVITYSRVLDSAERTQIEDYLKKKWGLVPPTTPTLLSTTQITDTSFLINWEAVSNADSYRLDVSTASDFSSFVTGFENLDVGNVTSQTVDELTTETTYYYRLRATNGFGTSDNSSDQTITAQAALERPGARVDDWSDFPNGTHPATIHARGTAVTGDVEVQEDVEMTGGKSLLMKENNTSRPIFTFESEDQYEDTDAVIRVRTDGADSGDSLFLSSRHQENSVSDDYYYAELKDGTTLEIGKVQDGVIESLVSESFTYEADTWYNFEFFTKGSNLKVKVWEDAEEEPNEWTATAKDETFVQGYAGFGGKGKSKDIDTFEFNEMIPVCDFSSELQSGEEVSWLIFNDDLEVGEDAAIEPSCGNDEIFSVVITHNDFVEITWLADDQVEEEY